MHCFPHVCLQGKDLLLYLLIQIKASEIKALDYLSFFDVTWPEILKVCGNWVLRFCRICFIKNDSNILLYFSLIFNGVLNENMIVYSIENKQEIYFSTKYAFTLIVYKEVNPLAARAQMKVTLWQTDKPRNEQAGTIQLL